jgi:hypothetical protein
VVVCVGGGDGGVCVCVCVCVRTVFVFVRVLEWRQVDAVAASKMALCIAVACNGCMVPCMGHAATVGGALLLLCKC